MTGVEIRGIDAARAGRCILATLTDDPGATLVALKDAMEGDATVLLIFALARFGSQMATKV